MLSQNFHDLSRLEKLPVELIEIIAGCLPLASLLRLRQCSSYMRWMIDESVRRKCRDLYKLRGAKSITSAGDYTLLATQSGQSYFFGSGIARQFGAAATEMVSLPRRVMVLSNEIIIQISAGINHSLFLTNTGKAYSCGSGDIDINHPREVYHRKNYNVPQLISIPHNVGIKQIAAGGYHTVVVTEDGSVYTRGKGEQGQLGRKLGPKEVWDILKPVDPNFFNKIPIKSVAAGRNYTLFLTEEGTVYACGDNRFGQLGVIDENAASVSQVTTPRRVSLRDRVAFLSANGAHTVFVTTNGKVYTCGLNDNGQLGLNDFNNRDIPEEVAFLRDKRVIFAVGGAQHTIFITDSYEVYGCGNTIVSQLGIGIQGASRFLQPTFIPGLANKQIIHASAGESHTVFLSKNGRVYGSGLNSSGQLGLGDTIERCYVPHDITFLPRNIDNLKKIGEEGLRQAFRNKRGI